MFWKFEFMWFSTKKCIAILFWIFLMIHIHYSSIKILPQLFSEWFNSIQIFFWSYCDIATNQLHLIILLLKLKTKYGDNRFYFVFSYFILSLFFKVIHIYGSIHPHHQNFTNVCLAPSHLPSKIIVRQFTWFLVQIR